jgi:hypothetical protein
MKTILAVFGLLLLSLLAWLLILRPGLKKHFGAELRGLEPAGIARMLEKPGDFLQKDVRIEGSVTRQCPQCGCWLILKDAGGGELKVEAGDLAEPVPYRPGRKVVVEGRLIRYGEGYEFVASALEFH